MRTVKFLSVSFVFAAFVGGCGDSSGGGSGAAIPATKSAIQTEIFSKSCVFSGCHDSTDAGGLNLQPGNALAELVNVPSESSALDRVEPGDPANSFLVKKLEGPLSGSEGDPMPLGAPALSNAKIQAIKTWIKEGAPEN